MDAQLSSSTVDWFCIRVGNHLGSLHAVSSDAGLTPHRPDARKTAEGHKNTFYLLIYFKLQDVI